MLLGKDKTSKFYRGGRKSGVGFLPSDISGLEWWLDGADSSTMTLDGSNNISQWDDKAGNSHDAQQGTGSAQPNFVPDSQNGLGAVVFNGTSDFMDLSTAVDDEDSTLYMILKFDAGEISSTTPTEILMTSQTAVLPRVALGVGSASGGISGEVLTNTVLSASGTNFKYIQNNIASGIRIIEMVNTGTSTGYAMDGVSQITLSSGTSSGTAGLRNISRIFKNRDAFTSFFDGTCYEIVSFSRQLNTSERAQMVAYFQNKWNIPFRPTSIPNLEVWYDGTDASSVTESGGSISQVDDLSGQGNDATQGTASRQPSYVLKGINKQNAITFDGTDDLLDTPYTWPLISSAFVAIKPAGLPTSGNARRIISNYVGGGALSNGEYILDILNAAGSKLRFTGFGFSIIGTDAIEEDTTYIAGCTHGGSGTTARLYLDNVQQGTGTNGSSVPLRDFSIGEDPLGLTGETFDGVISEVIRYGSIITDAERNALHDYLNNKYGIS